MSSELEQCKSSHCATSSKKRKEEKAQLDKSIQEHLKKYHEDKLTFEEFSKKAKDLQVAYNTSVSSKEYRRCLIEHCEGPLLKSIQLLECDEHELCKKLKDAKKLTLADFETYQNWINNKERKNNIDKVYAFKMFETILKAKDLLEKCQTAKCPKEKKAGAQQQAKVSAELKELGQRFLSKKISLNEFQKQMAAVKEQTLNTEVTKNLQMCTQQECKDLMTELLEATVMMPKYDCEIRGDQEKCKILKQCLVILKKPKHTLEDFQKLIKLLGLAA